MAANSVGYSEHLLRIAKSSHLFTGDLSVSLPAITEAAANALQVERVSVWFFNGERTGITCADLYENRRIGILQELSLRHANFPGTFRRLAKSE